MRSADIGAADYSEGDTSYIAVVDKDRNMVSFEPSLHSGFGTGVVMADLGFIFNCRAYNGCACVIARLEAYDRRGNRIVDETLLFYRTSTTTR